MKRFVLQLALVMLAMHATLVIAQTTEGASAMKVPAWLNEVHTYNILPMFPERAKELNVSVNGVWAGIPGRYSVLPHLPNIQEKYQGDQAAFVRDGKAAGLITCGVVNGIEGFEPLRADTPNLEDMACRKANGEVAGNTSMLLMCTNNPDWLAWEIMRGKEAIDFGVDLVLHDTPMSAAFLSGFLGNGFCDACMKNFEQWLNDHYSKEEQQSKFGLSGFDKAKVIPTLSPFQEQKPMAESVFVQETPEALLFQEFITCQEESMFRTRKIMMDALREHAKAKGRQVAYCTNAANLESANPGGHWVRALMFADLFDFFTYEQNSDPQGKTFVPMTPLPRGKWAAFHKLAYAVKPVRSATLLQTADNDAMGAAMDKEGKSFVAATAAYAAEAYAANGAYMTFYGDMPPATQGIIDKRWQGVFDHFGFVLEHKDLYKGDLRSGSPLAFLFLYNERGRTIPAVFPSYIGLAQGFTEGSYPYDVLFGGDDHYIKDRLTAAALSPYKTLIVPSPIAPTPNQSKLVQDFVRNGGTVVCQEPEVLGLISEDKTSLDETGLSQRFPFGAGEVLVLAGEVTKIETNDIGTRFFREYSADLRKQVHALAERLGLQSVLPSQQDGLLCAFPVLQPDQGRVVVHLVNYDIDDEKDAVRERQNVVLRVTKPAFMKGEAVASAFAPPSGESTSVEVAEKDGAFECTLPAVGASAVLVMASSSGSVS